MLSFFGIGSCFNTKLGNTSAFYLNNEELMIIDCGESVFADILSSKILEKDIRFINIVITHMHSDHIGSLPSLIFYLKFVKPVPYRIVCNPLIWDKMSTFLNICGISDNDIFLGYDVVSLNIKHIEFISSRHYHSMLSYHLDIQFIDNARIFYSGDCFELYDGFDLSKYNYVYLDASIYGKPHMLLEDIEKIIPNEERYKVYLMHIDDFNLIYKAQNIGFKIAKRIRM